MLDNRPTPDIEKSGLTDLELRRPPVLSVPKNGEGRVKHVGEGTRVKFRLRRVTNELLHDLGLPFTLRHLRINERDEEAQLVQALLRQRHPPRQSTGRVAGIVSPASTFVARCRPARSRQHVDERGDHEEADHRLFIRHGGGVTGWAKYVKP